MAHRYQPAPVGSLARVRVWSNSGGTTPAVLTTLSGQPLRSNDPHTAQPVDGLLIADDHGGLPEFLSASNPVYVGATGSAVRLDPVGESDGSEVSALQVYGTPGDGKVPAWNVTTKRLEWATPSAASLPVDHVLALMNTVTGVGPLVATSTDGTAWASTYATIAALNSTRADVGNLACNADRSGDTVVIAIDGDTAHNTLLVSTDGGVTWVSSLTFPWPNAKSVYYDGSQWIVGVGDGVHSIVTSPDLTAWTTQTTPLDPMPVYALAGDGTALVAGGNAGIGSGGALMRSTNSGVTWTAVTSDFDTTGWVINLAAHAGKIVAVGMDGTNGILATSADHGATWTTRVTGTGTAGVLSGLTHDGTDWWMCGIADAGLYKSADAVTWTLGSSYLTDNTTGLQPWVLAWDGSALYVTLDGGPGLLRSTDGGVTWTEYFVPGTSLGSAGHPALIGGCAFANRHAPTRFPARA